MDNRLKQHLAVTTLIDFVRTAPGRLPDSVQKAIDVLTYPEGVTHFKGWVDGRAILLDMLGQLMSSSPEFYNGYMCGESDRHASLSDELIDATPLLSHLTENGQVMFGFGHEVAMRVRDAQRMFAMSDRAKNLIGTALVAAARYSA